jgi:hypothetical protein
VLPVVLGGWEFGTSLREECSYREFKEEGAEENI